MKPYLQTSSLHRLATRRWKAVWTVSLGLSVLGLTLSTSLSTSVSAMTVQAVPNPRQANSWISDTQDLISPQNEAALNQQLTDLEAQTGVEMTVVTVDNTSGSVSPKAFATDLFNTWGVGKADEDNGVLFLVSVGDRRSEVEVGYGLESVLTQAEIESLLEKDAVPNFKQGDFDRGIVLATQSMIDQLDSGASIPNPLSSSGGDASSSVPVKSPSVPAAKSPTVGVSALTTQPLVVKILIIGSGAIAFIFVRFGTSFLTASTALTPGSCHRCGMVDFEAISQSISFVSIGFVSLFGLGAIAFLVTGLGSPLVGGSLSGIAGAVGFLSKKQSENEVNPFRCEDCGVSLNMVESSALSAHLSKAQRVASIELGSAAYKGWECPTCEGVAIRCTYPWSRYRQCPQCQEPTVEERQITVTRPTRHHTGQKKITQTCHCCDYSNSRSVTIPRLQEQSHSSSSGGFIGGGGGSSGGGGGSFGGGSSGGGGGGADW